MGRRFTSIAAALAVLLGLACGEGTGRTDDRPRNAVLLVIDTLRWDHLGSYGYERDTTPTIDSLARDGVRFERAYATAPWTKPSVASILTGLYPSGHASTGFSDPLADSVLTLPEILQAHGYATAGVVSNVFTADALGFSQGFETWVQKEAQGHDHVSTDAVTAQAVEILEKLAAGDRPFLLFVQYSDPHFNYKRHPEVGYAALTAGRLDGTQKIDGLRSMRQHLTREEIEFLRDLYDEEIRFTDAGVARLLEALSRLGLHDHTLVVLTADHGEEFLERGWLGHTRSLYEELVRVPLVIRDPTEPGSGRVVSGPVTLASLTPTLLELLGVEAEALGFQAPSLVPELRGRRDGPGRAVLSQVDVRGWEAKTETRQSALIGPRYKLVRDDLRGDVSLFDLSVDAEEARNLAPERPAEVERLSAALTEELRKMRRDDAPAPAREPSEAETQMLRDLGYYADP